MHTSPTHSICGHNRHDISDTDGEIAPLLFITVIETENCHRRHRTSADLT